LALVAAVLGISGLLTQCSNNPYRPGETGQSALYSYYTTPPTKLDPARAYYSHEGEIIDKIYEPPFAYHFLKRPYELIPLTAEEIPEPAYFDKDGRRLGRDAPSDQVARAEYTIRIKPGILYQDHPCFAKDDRGQPLYRNVTERDLKGIESPNDFPVKGTRELVAEDYALQIRRLADSRLGCPVYQPFENLIVGYGELRETYSRMLEEERERRKGASGAGYNQEQDEKSRPIWIDYMAPDLPGVKVVDRYTYKVTLTRKYPQILYWMAMHFFGPMPREALEFYSQPALAQRLMVIDRWPVGTGAYYLHTLRPNEIVILQRNPHYREAFYPSEGEDSDREQGFLDDAGKRIPFIDRLEMRLDKEAIPRWNKFLQGYYDGSGIAEDVFDQAVALTSVGDPMLSDQMAERGIRLATDVDTSVYYLAFNMLDDIVGGYTPDKQKLRQAISIAVDYNEYLDIFLNARGVTAQGPIPPGIFGTEPGEAGANPLVDEWDPVRKRYVRKPIEEARRLVAEAGYPEGRGKDGRPLSLYWDHASGGDPAFASQFEWFRGRFALLGIDLRERATDLRRFREKMDTGNFQIFELGWLADYPDPENFLFLFYGPNAKAGPMGPNGSNYSNPEFDQLFKQMESMENGPERLEIIRRALDVLRRDAPWVWGFHPVLYGLNHEWYYNGKPHRMTYDTLKFRRVDPDLRVRRQKEWNRPVVRPIAATVAALCAVLLPGIVIMHRRERGL
jgi:ABC-type transport system substrate-binding protein